jgi:SAM-dependent methyltransferase
VSLLAARMVGRQGAVLGIDRASSSVETAARRAAALGFSHARFQVADIATFKTDEKFDALVGRLVLLYLPDPAAVVRRLSQHLRPGGIVAFQEYDRSQFSQVPAGELFMQIKHWLLDAFVAAGTELGMGTKLYSTLVHAGLPPPSMVAATQVACGPSAPEYDYPGPFAQSPALHRTSRHRDCRGSRHRHARCPPARRRRCQRTRDLSAESGGCLVEARRRRCT